jgi:23S rRNA (cytidine1920-2'-O)/16S rRNA (cytidine1409-2'-O)-methyltransferase
MSARPAKQRADVLLVERGLCESRAKAQALIMAGQVRSGEQRVDKPGALLATDAPLSVAEPLRYVSRGGEKLHAGLVVFAAHGLAVREKICVDIGASTGGFTDCLLQHGAAKIYAVDVGWGQLHAKLRSDPRVVVRERTNAKEVRAEDFAEVIDLVVVDASFIGIGKLMPAIGHILAAGGEDGDSQPRGELVALVKPQFEAGRAEASRGRGVIRDPLVRAQAIAKVAAEIESCGFEIVAGIDSPVAGPSGNVEHLLYARRRHRTRHA